MSSTPETSTRFTGAHRAHREARDRAAARTLAHWPLARYEPYLDGLFTYCLSVLCDHDAATAALRDALALAEKRRGPEAAGDHRAWLYALARWEAPRPGGGGGPRGLAVRAAPGGLSARAGRAKEKTSGHAREGPLRHRPAWDRAARRPAGLRRRPGGTQARTGPARLAGGRRYHPGAARGARTRRASPPSRRRARRRPRPGSRRRPRTARLRRLRGRAHARGPGRSGDRRLSERRPAHRRQPAGAQHGPAPRTRPARRRLP